MRDRKPSATARFVASGIFHVATDPHLKNEVPPRMAELNRHFLASCENGQFPHAKARWKAGVLQRLAIPGFYLHFVLRKRWIEKQASKALAEGVTQLVVIGAGLDTLALRLGERYPELTCIEIDHPATQALKKRGMETLADEVALPTFIGLELVQQTLSECLLESATYDPQAKTLFVAEGLFMYLGEKEVCDILRFMRDHSGSGTSLLFTFMAEYRPGKIQFSNASRLVNFWLKLKGERFIWGLPQEDLELFLIANSFTLEALSTEKEFRAKLLTHEHRNVPLAQGEHVVWARVNE